MGKFSDALDRNMDDIKRPPPLPTGHYIFKITKMPDTREIEAKELEIVNFPVVAIEPLEDVDPDQLAEFGKVAGAPSRVSFMFSTNDEDKSRYEAALNRVKVFLGHCGIDMKDKSLKQGIGEVIGAAFTGEITHRLDERDGETVYAEISRTTPVA